MAQKPLAGQGLLIIEASLSHSDTPYSVGFSRQVIGPTQGPLTSHNTRKTQTSMQPAGFEPANPASWRPQTHALNRAATGAGN